MPPPSDSPSSSELASSTDEDPCVVLRADEENDERGRGPLPPPSDSGAETERMLLRPLGHIRLKLARYSMRDLGNAWFSSLLGIWHAYLCWVAACVFLAKGANELLRWWIRWYMYYKVDSNGHGLLGFLEVLAKSWIWISVLSELVRFCFLLGRDALRADAFEGYRRSICCKARAEEGTLYGSGWEASDIEGKWRWVNLVAQAVIYVSLDALPLVLLATGMSVGWRPIAFHMLTSLVVNATCLHVITFFAAWTLTGLYGKVVSFLVIWKTDNFHSEWEDDSLAADTNDCEQFNAAEEERSVRQPSRSSTGMSTVGGLAEAADFGGPAEPQSVAEQLNLCVLMCKGCIIVDVLIPHILWFSVVVAGAARRQVSLILGGSVWAILLCCFSSGIISFTSHRPCRPPVASWVRRLQSWGEKRCGLDFRSQLASRIASGVNILVLGNVFAFLEWWPFMIACVVMLSLSLAKQSMIYVEQPWGWLIGIVEGVGFHMASIFMSSALQGERRFADCALLLLLSFARECGLKQRLRDGMAIKNLSMFWLSLVQFVVVAILCMTINIGGRKKNFSAFCDRQQDNCTFTEFPYKDPKDTAWPMCSQMFQRFEKEPLTLGDFALFSSLTYETPLTIDDGLRAYFPSWHIDDRHFTTSPGLEHNRNVNAPIDWTTFYQFTDSENKTSVFAVRGTQYLIDVLQDIDLWLPAVTIMLFEKLGPNMHEAFVDAIAHLTNTGRQQYEKFAFSMLLRRVRQQMKTYPKRQFFITGHSLGGGIAKLVAAEIAYSEKSLVLPAVVFAAPGLAATSFVVFGHNLHGELARTAITAQPDHDFVSRIDTPAAVLPVPCSSNFISCHDIFNTICSIFRTCGSMRINRNISVPRDCAKLV